MQSGGSDCKGIRSVSLTSRGGIIKKFAIKHVRDVQACISKYDCANVQFQTDCRTALDQYYKQRRDEQLII